MSRRLDRVPRTERVYDHAADEGQPWFLASPRYRRFTEIWVAERRRQLGIGEAQR